MQLHLLAMNLLSGTLIVTCVVALLGTLSFFVAKTTKYKRLLLVGFTVVPVVVILSQPFDRLISYHSLWHSAVVYRTIHAEIPPEHPLLSETPLLYPWIGNMAVGLFCSWPFELAPPNALALLIVLATIANSVLLWKLARLFWEDRLQAYFCSFFPIFGISCFDRGPIAEFLRGILPMETGRIGIPPFEKLLNINMTPFGMLGFTCVLIATVRLLNGNSRNWSSLGLLATSLMLLGMIYPFYWLTATTCFMGTMAVYVGTNRTRASLTRGVLAVAICCAVGIVLSPYLLSIGSGKEQEGAMLLSSVTEIGEKAAKYILLVAPLATIMLWMRKALWQQVQQARSVAIILATNIGVSAGLYCCLSLPEAAEYKFALISSYVLGFVAGLTLYLVYQQRRLAFVAICFVFLLPFGDSIASHLKNRFKPVPYITVGSAYRVTQSADQEMYDWILENTNPNAIMVDEVRPDMAVFAQRAVYCGKKFDTNWVRGWYPCMRFLGYSKDKVNERVERMVRLYSVDEFDPNDLKAIVASAAGRDVYVVSRDDQSTRRFVGRPELRKVFGNKQNAVFRLID